MKRHDSFFSDVATKTPFPNPEMMEINKHNMRPKRELELAIS